VLGLLQLIANTVAAIGSLVLWATITAINSVIAALGALLALVLSVLPQLPDVPDNPAPQAVGWVAWFMPVTVILAFMAVLLAAYVLLLLWRVVLRWVKAL
jgi:hypothetical protein